MKKISFYCIAFILCAFKTDNDLINRLATTLAKFDQEYPQEKVFLHFDKPYYATQDTIWLKAYITEANTLLPTIVSRVLYVEMISPDAQVVNRKMLKIQDGTAHADFAVSHSLKAGTYQIRAYTKWMQNFDNELLFTKNIPIFDLKKDSTIAQVSKKIKARFFPEGGELVNGLRCKVAFKATNQNGEGESIKGYIADNEGKKMVSLKTEHLGMGSFRLIPEKGKYYEAHIFDQDSSETVEKLPIAKEEGFALVVVGEEQDSIFKVNIYASPQMIDKQTDIVLISQAKNQIFHAFQGKIDKQILTANIPKSKLPEGITQLTLFDSKGEPYCERLVFKTPSLMGRAGVGQVTLNPDKATYKSREKAKLAIEIKDENGKPTEGNFSIAVTNAIKVTENEIDRENITNYMLLRSEVGGEIEKPAYYFQKGKYDALDLLLMTQGWRRFSWKKLLDTKDSIAIAYQPEIKGFTVRGEVFDEKTNKAINDATLVVRKVNAFATSDKSGLFSMSDLDFEGEAEIIAQAAQFKDKKLNIFFEEKQSPQIQVYNAQKKLFFDEIYSQNRKKQFEADMAFDEKIIILKEVEIKGQSERVAIEKQDEKVRTILGLNYGKPDYVIRASENQDVFAVNSGNIIGVLMSKPLPGLRVIPNASGSYTVTLTRGAFNSFNNPKSITFMIDGLMVDSEMVQSMPASNVISIEVLKRAIPTMNISNGVVSIITKNNRIFYDKFAKIDRYQVNGYYKAREFYAPDYEKINVNSPKPDLRSTIYWNPNVMTKDGKASISFFTADSPKQYRVVIEGISKEGKTVSEVKLLDF